MKKKQIGIGVIGCGRIGSLRASLASSHPSVRYLALSDKNPQQAENLAENVAADYSSNDNYEIISNPEVDAVFVSTPEHDHTESILQAIELGKPVFVEKPLTLSLEEADRIIEKLEEKGTDLRIGYSRRHDRRWMLAREQVEQGRLGKIIGIQSRVYSTRAQIVQPLKRSPHASPVNDVLTYYVDMACWFLKDLYPVEVFARGNSRVFKEMGFDKEDVTWTIITFNDGTVVNLGISCVLPAKYPTYGQSARFEVIGQDGVILLDTDNKDSVLYTDKGVPHAYVPGHDANMLFMQTNSSGDWAMGEYWGPISNETRGWLDHLSTGKPCNHTTAKEGRQTLAVTIAIEKSSKTGQTIKLNS